MHTQLIRIFEKIKKSFSTACVFASLLPFHHLWAHGESQPGPHGGYIRMPGAFHTELVLNPQSRMLDVYLLDMNFSSPTIDRSRLKVRYLGIKNESTLDCKAQKSWYQCPLPQQVALHEGKFIVSSERSGVAGVDVEYKLPLRFTETSH